MMMMIVMLCGLLGAVPGGVVPGAGVPSAVVPGATQPVGEVVPALASGPIGRLSAEASVDELLAALHLRGLDLRNFDADVTLTDTDGATGADTSRAGRFLYHRIDDFAARARVTFETKDEGKGPRAERLEYLLDGLNLVDRNYRKKIEVTRQVVRPGQRVNLLKLGEGPFPLPIGQSPAEVRRQFEVSLLSPDNASPRMRLTPKANTNLARKFSQIDVTVDPVTHFPTTIETIDPNETQVRTTTLKNTRVNPEGGLKDSDFTLPAIGDDWQRLDEKYAE